MPSDVGQPQTTLTKAKSVIVIEDLAARGMVRNRRLARAVSAAGCSGLRCMLERKGEWYGCRIVAADRF